MKSYLCLTRIAIGVSAALFVAAAPALGIPSEPAPSQSKCQAAKTKASGDYVDCRQTAEAKFVKTSDAAKQLLVETGMPPYYPATLLHV